MRVLQINTERGWRGGERQTLFTARGLLGLGLEVDLLCRRSEPLARRAAEEPGLAPRTVNSQGQALAFLLRHGRDYDILHAQTARGQSLAVLAKAAHRRPIVYTRRVDFPPRGLSARLKYAATNRTVAISQAIADILARMGVQAPVIYSVFEPPAEPDPALVEALRREWRTDGRHLLATAAAFVPHKDPLNMVRAVAALRELRGGDFRFLHFGEGELRPRAEALARELNLGGVYHFMGFVDPLAPWFKALDGFVMASREEGLGSVVLDAFHFGAPVASTDAGGLPELVAGRGFLAPREDPRALAQAMHELLNQPERARAQAQAAQRHVAERHDLRAAARRYTVIYEECLRRPEGMIPSGHPIRAGVHGPGVNTRPMNARPEEGVWGGSSPPAAGGVLPRGARGSSAPVAVALSGGGDSLAALLALREAGREVLPLHGRFLDPAPGREEALAELCEGLGLRLTVLELRDAFEEAVIRPFAREYARGLTPNPCALCNPAIKFGALLDAALEMGAEALATGHFARLAQTDAGPRLSRGFDPAKEQSYFLSLVPARSLARAVLPLADMVKEDLRRDLARRGVTPPAGRESQEICFVPRDDYRGFLVERLGGESALGGPGPILLAGEGRELGRHQGLWRHTLGQRRGLGVAFSEPLYVVGKDLENNALLVGPAEALRFEGCAARKLNLLVPPEDWPEEVLAQVRYRQRGRPATAELDGELLRVRFKAPGGPSAPPPAPGQVLALYDAEGRVLAGGIIEEIW